MGGKETPLQKRWQFDDCKCRRCNGKRKKECSKIENIHHHASLEWLDMSGGGRGGKAPFLSHNSHFHNCGLATFWKYCFHFVQIRNGKRTALVLLWLLCGSLPKQQGCVSDTWIYFSDWSSWLLNVEGRVLHSLCLAPSSGFGCLLPCFLSPTICLVPDSRVFKPSGIYFFCVCLKQVAL